MAQQRSEDVWGSVGAPGTGNAVDELPPVPDEIREAAGLAPNHWLGMADPTWSGEGKPSEWAPPGPWRPGLDGGVVREDNPDCRTSPVALGRPEPEDEVERVIRRAVTGYGPDTSVTRVLVGREEAVLTGPDGSPLSAAIPDGTPVVAPFTSLVFLHAVGRLAYASVKVDEFVGQVPEGYALCLNSSGTVGMTRQLDAPRDAVRDVAVVDGGAAKRTGT